MSSATAALSAPRAALAHFYEIYESAQECRNIAAIIAATAAVIFVATSFTAFQLIGTALVFTAVVVLTRQRQIASSDRIAQPLRNTALGDSSAAFKSAAAGLANSMQQEYRESCDRARRSLAGRAKHWADYTEWITSDTIGYPKDNKRK